MTRRFPINGKAATRVAWHLFDELRKHGWTQKDLAQTIRRPAQAICEIANGKKRVTAETAIDFESAFGVDALTWLTYQSLDDLDEARKERR